MRSALHRWFALALLVLVPMSAWAGIPKNNKTGDFWRDQWKAAEVYMLPPHIWSVIIAIVAIIGTHPVRQTGDDLAHQSERRRTRIPRREQLQVQPVLRGRRVL